MSLSNSIAKTGCAGAVVASIASGTLHMDASVGSADDDVSDEESGLVEFWDASSVGDAPFSPSEAESSSAALKVAVESVVDVESSEAAADFVAEAPMYPLA